MATIGRSPGKGHSFVTYTWDSVPPDSKRNGYLAGNVHGLICHVGKKTKPCRRQLIGTKADCPHCDQREPTDWVGYVPLRDHTGRPTVILIRSAVASVVDKIKPESRVMWGRDDDRFAPVWLIPGTLGQPWSYWWPAQKANDDMVPWLCTFWRTPELLSALYAYFKQECQPAVTGPAPIPPVLTDPQTPDWVKGTADKLTQSELGQSLGEVFKRRGITDAAASPNGNGKKKH